MQRLANRLGLFIGGMASVLVLTTPADAQWRGGGNRNLSNSQSWNQLGQRLLYEGVTGRPYYGGGYNRGYYGNSYYGNSYYGNRGYYSGAPSSYYYNRPSYYYDPGIQYAPSYSSPAYVVPAAPIGSANIQVTVPDPNAEVWFNGQKTQQSGTQRVFNTPSLEAGYTYSYNISAAWHQNGQLVTRERNVTIRPGESMTVNFTQ